MARRIVSFSEGTIKDFLKNSQIGKRLKLLKKSDKFKNIFDKILGSPFTNHARIHAQDLDPGTVLRSPSTDSERIKQIQLLASLHAMEKGTVNSYCVV